MKLIRVVLNLYKTILSVMGNWRMSTTWCVLLVSGSNETFLFVLDHYSFPFVLSKWILSNLTIAQVIKRGYFQSKLCNKNIKTFWTSHKTKMTSCISIKNRGKYAYLNSDPVKPLKHFCFFFWMGTNMNLYMYIFWKSWYC